MHKEEFVKLYKYMRIYLWTILRIKFFKGSNFFDTDSHR